MHRFVSGGQATRRSKFGDVSDLLNFLLLSLGPDHSKLLHLVQHCGKILKERALILGVHLNVRSEHLILQKCVVGGQKHLPWLGGAYAIRQQLLVVAVVKNSGVVGPRPIKPRYPAVAPAHRVSSAEGHNLTVGQTHALEGGAQLGGAACRCGQSPGGALLVWWVVSAAGLPGDSGAPHRLNSHHSSQGPDIRHRNIWVLLLYAPKRCPRRLQPSVVLVLAFSLDVAHACVRPTRVGLRVPGGSILPR
mmetsp:Transcript_110610/g.253297  ORF Transcript_110610/g.253297 Transcript_110610/m.253297 type:complete len:248 (+) Transcript_110610:544-1287(+)